MRSAEEKIRHLWRRAAFGARPEELRRSLSRGLAATVEDLVGYVQGPPAPAPPPMPKIPPGVRPTLLLLAESVRWWLERLVTTERPLEERLTLFWHRHFATSAARVFSPGLMLTQNEVLRRNAGGRFGELLTAVVEDAAMIRWLDLQENSPEHPNENFGRELLELYTTGPGAYTEADVQAVARCFTGWGLELPGFRFRFDPRRHDDSPLRILDLSGQVQPRDLLGHLAVHPATARRLCRRLWEAFGYSPAPAEEVERLSGLWRSTGGHVLAVVRQMLLSPRFYAPQAWCAHAQSPLELYLFSMRLLELTPSLKDVATLYGMGEAPFFPPGVKGWQEGTPWLHPTALLERFQLVLELVERLPADHVLLSLLETLGGPAERKVEALVRGSCLEVGAATRRELARHVGSPRQLLGLLLSSPEFQAA